MIKDIVEKKQKLAERLVDASEELLLNTYKSLSSEKNLKEVYLDIQRINLSHIAPNEALMLKRQVMRLAHECKKRMPLKKDISNGLLLFPLLSYKILFKRLHAVDVIKNRIINPIANEYEAKEKQKAIDSAFNFVSNVKNNAFAFNKNNTTPPTIEENKKSDVFLKDEDAYIFVIISKHDDCAEDHLKYQGKIYYDRFWRNKVSDEKTRKAINIFISKNKLKSFQWVINKPVWMITRPNCRHYFKSISVKEALNNDAEDILLNNEMVSDEGKRGNRQTINHNTNKKWYTRRNALSLLKKYQKRLVFLKRLYKKAPNEELKNDIAKNELLIRKWKRYIKKHLF